MATKSTAKYRAAWKRVEAIGRLLESTNRQVAKAEKALRALTQRQDQLIAKLHTAQSSAHDA